MPAPIRTERRSAPITRPGTDDDDDEGDGEEYGKVAKTVSFKTNVSRRSELRIQFQVPVPGA